MARRKVRGGGRLIFPRISRSRDALRQDDRVIGVRTGDKGIDKEGKPKANFEPGVDLHAR